MELTPGQAADAAERHDCPKCGAPAGSPCRTRGGKTAVKYHTARFVLVPALREELEVPVPGDRGPDRDRGRGGGCRQADPDRVRPLLDRPAGTRQPDRGPRGRAVQADLLREDQHPHQRPARAGEGAQARPRHQGGRPDQPVILVVHELKRLARNAAELMTLSAQLQAAGIRLELLTGPLTGVYDPGGMGSMLFAVLAVAAQFDRDYIREKTLEGQAAAAAKGNHGGRPKVIDDDMLTFAVALKNKGVSVPEIAGKLVIKAGKNAGKHPSVASLYRALAEADDTAA
jgi:hypothetical protein